MFVSRALDFARVACYKLVTSANDVSGDSVKEDRMHTELTLAVIRQDREAAYRQIVREREAREATANLAAAERTRSTSYGPPRLPSALARLLLGPVRRSRHA